MTRTIFKLAPESKFYVDYELAMGVSYLLLASAANEFNHFSEGKFEDIGEMKCFLKQVKEYLENIGHFELVTFIDLVNIELDNY